MLDALLEKMPVEAVVLSSQWAENGVDNLDPTLEFMSRKGVRTIVIGPTPTFRLWAPALLVQSGLKRAGADTRLKATDFQFDAKKSEQLLHDKIAGVGLPYIAVLHNFCDTSGCLAFVPGKDETLMYWDNQHLTVDGIFWLGDIFSKDSSLRKEFAPDGLSASN